MLTVEQAHEAVIASTKPLPPRRAALLDALGCVLAETVCADLDLPPFDKALVDGYAIASDECQGDECRFMVGEEIAAEKRLIVHLLREKPHWS